MVTGIHPDEIDLFDYVEGDLPPERAALLEVHLASCAECAEHVARVTAGREALRRAQFLQLPARRREAMFAKLPEQPRERPRRAGYSPKRLLAILTPLVAVAAIVAVLANTNGGSSNEEAGQAAGTLTAKANDQAGGGAGAEVATGAFRSVEGPADAVASELRSKGLDARVAGQRVEVRDATRSEVNRALGRRREGQVEIVIVP
jgi:anti-sigma factor RsiW